MSRKSRPTTMHSAAVVMAHRPQVTTPRGGRVLTGPTFVNRRVQVGPDLWVTLTTLWRDHRPIYVVAAVDSLNVPTTKPQKFPTLLRARNAANKLYAQLTEENQ